MGGKVTRLKGDLDDVDALLEIISVIKDVATNRFFTFAQGKANFRKFFEVFLDFFRSVQNIETDCPLLRNNNPKVAIVAIASDQSFMAQGNSRISSITLDQVQKNPGAKVVVLGRRCAEKMRIQGLANIERVFVADQYPDRYALSLALRECIVDLVMSGQVGRVILIHLWAKTFSIIKPRILTLLPASELVTSKGDEDTGEVPSSEGEEQLSEASYKMILESSPEHIMKALADIWIHSRLYELASDILLVESAIQSQQLESAMESLGSEKKALLTSFRKAGRDELNKSMREVFTQTSFTKGPRR
ncbi:MAG: F0F1 ATP synthase subunit gamma [Candidatus Omnitrophica bacterium]|nr:F0F1 ATP synthase subunit gamma [Candidatus Omnitrophota bacterium]